MSRSPVTEEIQSKEIQIKEMQIEEIQVTVKLFAIFQEVFAADEMQIKLESGASVSQIFDRLVSQQPHLEKWRSLTRYAINLNFADQHTLLHDGDEVALIPPVSGG